MLTDEDEARMRHLLERSPDSLGYFNLRRDKSVVWSESGKAAIAYRVVSGVMLASGDPLGDPEAWPGAIGGLPARGAGPRLDAGGDRLLRARRAGLVPARPGSPRSSSATRRSSTPARSPSRAGRCATCARWSSGSSGPATPPRSAGSATCPTGERRRALTDAAAWRSTETERGFSMALGRVVDPADPDCVWVVARQDGVMRAFLQFVPWGTDGMSLDLMRRDRTAEPGVNELADRRTRSPGPPRWASRGCR